MKFVTKVTILLIVVFLAFTASTANADEGTQKILDGIINEPFNPKIIFLD